MMGMAGIAFGVGIVWMVVVAQPAPRLLDGPGGWLAALAAGIALAALGLWLLGRAAAQRERARAAERDAGTLEQEVLAALATQGTLTPAETALRTSLTIDEAGPLLEALASMGAVQAVEGADGQAYNLTGAPDLARAEAARGEPDAAPDEDAAEGPVQPVTPLSERELDVLALAATGRTDREIAGALTLPDDAVAALTDDISRKLGVRSRNEAIVRARALALV